MLDRMYARDPLQQFGGAESAGRGPGDAFPRAGEGSSNRRSLWQVDFKGPLWSDTGALTPLSESGGSSRYLLNLEPHSNNQAEPLRAALRRSSCATACPG